MANLPSSNISEVQAFGKSVPAKVGPATEDGAANGTFTATTPFESFKGFVDQVNFWVPYYLNLSATSAKGIRAVTTR